MTLYIVLIFLTLFIIFIFYNQRALQFNLHNNYDSKCWVTYITMLNNVLILQ